MNRRSFLTKVSGSFPLLYFPTPNAFSANDRLQIGAIGVGGKGGSDLQQLARHGELVAACDVSTKKLDYALRDFPFAAKFSDYREMISHMGEKIDVLSIATPDHTHAHAAQLALSRGIHLFVQAPLAHTVWEARQLLQSVKTEKVCTQVGLQGCASDNFRLAVEYLQAGKLGNIEEIHVWTNRPVWPQSPDVVKRPTELTAVPDGFNWDAFLGPAEERPYSHVYQPYNWRGWRAFGSGALGDVGVHLLNLPVLGCSLSGLKKVSSLLVGPVNEETYQAWATVKYEFANVGKLPDIPLFWYEGRLGHIDKSLLGMENLPPRDFFLGRPTAPNGCLIRGAKGTLMSPSIFGTKWEVHLGKKWLPLEKLELSNPKLARNNRGDSGMKEELVTAIRSGKTEKAMANFESSYKVNEIAILGNVALLAGGSFEWDSSLCRSNRSDVNDLLTKTYRKGWSVQSG